ncbi:MAG: electron transport complex subunit RsxD, partial [Gammaproteobacteria bacterium]|nr:electron transport complex subunit RsxD [Gammaproteobacteria bacterium]
MTTAKLMQITLLALAPGAIAMTFWWGPGILVNLIVAATLSALLEQGYAKLRRVPMPSGGYGAAILAGCLLALCLPPYVPISVLIIGVVAGLVLGKYVYGGLGNNPFNPALVGYCFIMISFPAELTFWMHPTDGHWDWQSVLAAKMFASTVDGYSGATLLDTFRHRGALTVEEMLGVTSLFDRPHTLINVGFLLGGLVLLALRIIRYQAPLGFLLGLALPALLFFDSGS